MTMIVRKLSAVENSCSLDMVGGKLFDFAIKITMEL